MTVRGFVGILLTLVVGGVIAWSLGRAFGERAAESNRERVNQERRAYLSENLNTLAAGKPLPALNVTDPKTLKTCPLHDLINKTAAIVYVSGTCESCVSTVSNLAAAMGDVRDASAKIIIVAGGEPSGLASYMTDHGIDIPLYQDTESSFYTELGINVFPSFIIVDSNLVVLEIGIDLDDVSACRALLSRIESPGSR